METNNDHSLKNPASGGIFCFSALLFIALLGLSGSSFSQARLEVAEAKKSFGTVPKGDVVKLDYAIKNTGDQPLMISDAEVSCSCTHVDFSKQPLLPGQNMSVTVSFDTKSAYGRQDRIVYLNSNDPKSPAKLRYKGVVQPKN